MTEATINLWAVLSAAVVSMLIGALWYSPVLFGNAWIKLSGISKEDIEKTKEKGFGKTYLAAFGGVLITSYVMAHIIDYVQAATFLQGAETGFWLWLGFVAPVLLGIVLWEGKPVKLYLINAAQYLVSLTVMGGILAVWG